MPPPFVPGIGSWIAFPNCMPEPSTENKNIVSAPTRGRTGKPALLLPLLILAGISVWFWADRGGDSSAAPSGEPHTLFTLHLDTFVLNLADPDQRSYLRVGIDLGLNKELKRGEEAVPVAQVRDTILGVLAQAKVEDLATAAGKTKLKQSLLQALQDRIPQLGVEEVYFTEFLIQR